MKITKIELPFNYFHFILIGLILFILSLTYNYLFVFLIIYLIFLFKEYKIIKYTMIILFLSLIFSLFQPKEFNQTNFYATVVEIEESSYTNKLTLKIDNTKVYAYIKKDININIGDYGYFECSVLSYSNSIYNGSFDYNEYLYNSYISNRYYVNNYSFVKKKFVLSMLQHNIKEYFNNNLEDETLKYSLMLILGIDSFSDDENDILSTLGIMHLFCISGMHINFILLSLSVILKKFKISDNKIEVVQVVFALVLLIITNFQISVIRAFLMFVLSYIFKKLKLKYTSLDVISITAILILLFRPRYLYLVSFQLTFLVSFVIIITNDLYKGKSLLKSLCIQSLVAFATTFPIIVNINYEINILTILFTTIISIPFTYIIMPITFISAIFRVNLFNPIFYLFDSLLSSLSLIDIFVFSISKLNIFYIIIYYILIYLILKSVYTKKHLYKLTSSLIIFLFCIVNTVYLNNVTTVTFFDVSQGDSSLISLAYNKGNILIDCYNGVGNYIKTRGIDTIDYVIITHAHNDHMGDLEVIKKDFNVKGVVCSYYDQDSKKLNCDNYVKANDKIEIDNITINFIAPYQSNADINQASLVFKTIINGYTFMYTGDTTSEVEEQMLNKNIDLKSDVLKVPHHGSSTSSSIDFVNSVYPKYAIFSYGESNSYGLPDYDVINRYNMSINYHTAISGHIEFYYKKEWLVRFYK